MKKIITTSKPDATAMVEVAWQTVGESFDHFCLTAGIATLAGMLEDDAERLCGSLHGRLKERDGHRWGRTTGRLAFHGGTIPVERPRVRGRSGELALPSWEAARSEDWLGKWAMNLMLLNVSTRKFGRAVEGATESAATVQALLDNLIGRGLDPELCRLFVVDGAKALTKAIRRTFGRHTPIQRCQIHKARNIVERLPKHLHAPVRKALRQAWEIDDAHRAEQLIRNLAQRLEREAPGVAASILEGLDEILTVTRLRLPKELRRSLACTNIIENMNGTIRRVCGNVKRWRDASMALRWTAAGMIEAAKGFRRLKAWKQLPALKAALNAIQPRHLSLEHRHQAA